MDIEAESTQLTDSGVPAFDVVVDKSSLDEATQLPPKKARRRRVKKDLPVESSTLQEEESGQSSISHNMDTSVQLKPRRGRRSTARTVQAEQIAATDDCRQPRNQLAAGILENLSKFPHCILLTRVGQFYESYFDQAGEVARLLNIKLTSRVWDGQRILMCGFPLMHLHKYLKVLVQQNTRFVALCEEFPRYSTPGVKPTFDRRVVRVVTPGTLIDEPFLNPFENNYLLSIATTSDAHTCKVPSEHPASESLGLAWIDVSTGEFFTKETKTEFLRDELVRISPCEVVLSDDLQSNSSHPILKAILEEGCTTSYITPSSPSESESELITSAIVSENISCLPTTQAPGPGLALSVQETAAIRVLTSFLRANLLEFMPRLSSPNREGDEARMQIDSHTIKALEIREGMREGGATGSLLNVVKRTITSGGARLLARWLCSPSTSIAEINARQSLVSFFYCRPALRKDLVGLLQTIEDATRIVQKFLLGRGAFNDMSAINSSFSVWAAIKSRLHIEKIMEGKEKGRVSPEEWASVDTLMSRMDDMEALSHRINLALKGARTEVDVEKELGLDESSSVEMLEQAATDFVNSDFRWQNTYKWSINATFSDELSALHNGLQNLLHEREKLERRLQFTFDAPSLTLRSSITHGLHVHVARAKRDGPRVKASSDFAVMSESNSTVTLFHHDWSQLGSKLIETSMAISAAEKEAFEGLRNEVSMQVTSIRRNARIVDELDVTLGFANLATEMCFVKPTITADNSFHIVNGRHPTVELGLLTAGRVFTPNTVRFSPDSRLHIITGPNMAGKSTLLRQTALVAILAQTGSFVPADHAVIGIVDRLFSRVGAKDDLFRDRSTFMVEMLETAEILQRATPNSLVIMDEVGRGTTLKDGLAIAFATVHHLYSQSRCRALFATHFHELTDMLGHSADHKGMDYFKDIGFFCTDVDEIEDGHFAYSHRLQPGVNRDSHGLKVAQLAGMPTSALTIANNALTWLKQAENFQGSSPAGLAALGKALVSTVESQPHTLHA